MIAEASREGTLGLEAGITTGLRVRVWSQPGAGKPRKGTSIGRIWEAFQQGAGHGVVYLASTELEANLIPSLGFWRMLGEEFLREVCAALNPMDPCALVLPEVDPELMDQWIGGAPPMRGGELLTVGLLLDLWNALGAALTERVHAHGGDVLSYLAKCHSSWHAAGRVCLHLAENKGSKEFPFAFIATYARRIEGRSDLQYVPLGRAMEEYAGARNKQRLLALLRPLQRAAEQNEWVRKLVESGDVYHPLAWTAGQAHGLLSNVESLEKAGLVMRVPGWWKGTARLRPTVAVTVGGKAPSSLGLQAMLDFDVKLTLGGKRLTSGEMARLLKANEGLLWIKGRWVEVDAEKLGQVLDHWLDVQELAASGGISFAEAMRMMAGAAVEGSVDEESSERPLWSQVIAGKWLNSALDGLRDPRVQKAIDGHAGLRAELRPYQKTGVQWLLGLHDLGLGGCLADDMGLGKTIQVIGLLSMLARRSRSKDSAEVGRSRVDLLVVPASLVGNWEVELARFAPRLRPLVAHPSRLPSRDLKALQDAEVEASDLVITTYGTLTRTPWMAKRAWRCVVLDEAQAIKNPSTKQTRAVKKLKANWRLALTGTPVENSLGDLWSIFDFLNPGLLGTAKGFGRFCKTMSAAGGEGFAPLRKLVSPYIMRRLKTDKTVISDLPDKTEFTTHCLLSKHQATLYKQAIKELKDALKAAENDPDAKDIQRKGLVLAFLMRFKQICNHPSQWLGDKLFDPQESGKFQRLSALSEPIAARQEKLLIFTQFRSMTGPLQRHLTQCFGRPGLVLHGGTPVKKRQALVRQFQEDEEVPYLVLSLKAGGTGLNLTAANHVIHFDRWWNPAVETQATDRAFRIGQKRNVLVHKFVCQGTIEERIDEMIASKRALSDKVLSKGAEVKLTELSNEELLQMVSLDIQSAVTT